MEKGNTHNTYSRADIYIRPVCYVIVFIFINMLIGFVRTGKVQAAEIFIDRTGTRQLNFSNLTDGSMNNLQNDPIPEFNWYIGRDDAMNPLEWTHQWDPAQPSDGTIPLDADEVYTNMLAAELFPVIWDIDYPVSNEHDDLYWDSVAYAGGGGAAFNMAGNPAAEYLGLVEGNNNYWGAKRISLDPTKLAPGDVEYFWLRVCSPTGGTGWKTSIDYVDLAIIFNMGALNINKTATHVSGFDPPRVGHTSTYRVRIDISNPTTTASGGPMYDVVVNDVFPAGSTIVTAPGLGSATLDAAGNLVWNVGILQDGASNVPAAAGSTDFMEVLVSVTPTKAQEGVPVTLNAGATINGGQVPLDPGDGTGTMYPFNFHSNIANQTTAVSVLVATPNVDPANTGTIAVTPNILPGQTVTVTVTDNDLNTDPAAADTVAIPVVNQATGETETVTCTETGAATGIFTGTLGTTFGTAAGANNSGNMNVQAGDTLRATYNDTANFAGNPATVTADTTVSGGDTAVLTASANICPGDPQVVTLTDDDLNTNAGAVETTTLTVTNARSGEQETITLTETGANTGIFSASVPTAYGTAAGADNDGAMVCMNGDNLNIPYNDALTTPGSTASISATTVVVGGSDGVLLMSALVTPGQNISVSLIDGDLNTNPAAVETFTITLTNNHTGETESITLTETGVNTGEFNGVAPTQFSTTTGTNNNGVFNVQSGHTVSAVYNDAFTVTGGIASVSFTTSVGGGSTAVITSTASIIPGQTATFTLSDGDLNTIPGTAETFNLTVQNTVTGETELITLTETGTNTGIFQATIPTAYNTAAGANNNGSFNIIAGHALSTTYNDAMTTAGGTATISTQTQVTGGTDGIINATDPVAPGQTISAFVQDADLNTNPATVQTVTITIVNDTTGESETMTFTENGTDSNTFTADIPTKYSVAAGTNNDGIFFVRHNHTITFTYNDALTADGGTVNRTRTITVVDDTNFVTITSPSGSYNTATHNVVGTTDPLSTVTMKNPLTGGALTTTADADGNYTFASVTFPEGTTVFTVSSTDPEGNVAAEAANILVDTLNSITVTAPLPNSTIPNTSGTVSGTTDPDSTVTFIEPGTGSTITVTADFNGNFSVPNMSFLTGANTINFTSVDPMNNTATATLNFFVDPDIILNITSITNGAVYANPMQEVAGWTDPNANVTTTDPVTGATLAINANSLGYYTFGTFMFTEGPQTVTVSAVDNVGNRATTSVTFTIDSSNSNNIITSGVQTDPNVDITGTTNPGSTVVMTHPINGEILTVIANSAGVYVFENVYLTDGSHTVTTISTDTLGNVAVDVETLIVDATVEAEVDLPPNDSVVDEDEIDITGTTDPGSTVTIIDPATDEPITVTADDDGDFTIPDINLNPGENTITIVIIDPAGNTTSIVHTITYNPDIFLNITNPVHNSVVKTGTQTVRGNTEAGATVTTTHPGTGATLTTTADVAGAYAFADLPFPTGQNTVTVTATDVDGNTASSSVTFVVANTGVDGELSASIRAVFGFPIFIEVTDPETYLNPLYPDVITVEVANPNTGDSEEVRLLETAANSGVFRGRLETIERETRDDYNSGFLAVKFGDIVTTTYKDAIRADGSLDVPIEAQTLITNDELRVNVNVISTTGHIELKPLAAQDIAILEFDAKNRLTGNVENYTTNSEGNVPTEFIGRIQEDRSYRVLIKNQFEGFPYSSSDPFDVEDIENLVPDARGVRTLVLVLDPAGYVYDAVTGARINGADVTLYHESGATVAGPFNFFTQLPAQTQTNPQLSGDSGVAGGFEFIGAAGGSDITPGFYYITITFNTTPALGGIYSPIPQSSASWAGISEPYTGQVFRVDQQNQPIGMRVPLLPESMPTPLVISKTANKDSAAVGEFITFTVSVRNLSSSATDPGHPVTIRDMLPTGLSYVKGSGVRDDGAPLTVTQYGGGEVHFEVGQLQAAGNAAGGDSVTIYYQAAIDTSTRPGALLTNRAVAMIQGVALSNTDSETVRVNADPIFDLATLIGRVFYDDNANGRFDKGERGVSGAGVLLDDGTYITTDEYGRYSAAGVAPGMELTGTRVVKLVLRDLPEGARPTTPVARFVTLRPGGIDKANFGVIIMDPEEEEESPENAAMFLVMFDLAAGEITDGAKQFPRPDNDVVPEGGLFKGRLAFVFSGRVLDKFDVTTTYDSHKLHSFGMTQDMDSDLFYPTYGDGSRSTQLADTQGKFFLDAGTQSGRFRIGNYSASFRDTDLAGVRRALYGTKYEFKKFSSDPNSQAGDTVTIFTAKHKQLHARTDLRSTGGSHYYLAHDRIAPGSESVTVEIRDALAPERVLARRTLTANVDYEIDYQSGALRLFSPLQRYDYTESLVQDGLGGGNPIWLVAEYLYNPERNDYGTVGARWLHWHEKGLGLGATYLRENTDGRDHTLRGYDLHFKQNGKEWFKAEWARSVAGGTPWHVSHDGGRSFTQLGATNNSGGTAYKVDFSIPGIRKLEWNNTFYVADPDFTGAYHERGIRRWGTNMIYRPAENQTWKMDYWHAVTLAGAGAGSAFNTGGAKSQNFRLNYTTVQEKHSFAMEFVQRRIENPAAGSNREHGVTSTLAMRYEKKMTERIAVSLKQQMILSDGDEYLTTIGVKYKMRKDMDFTVEFTAGTQGAGGRAGFEKRFSNGATAYFSAGTGYSPETGEKTSGATTGVSGPVGDRGRAYLESESESTSDENISRRTVGLNQTYDADGGFTTVLSVERSEERSSLQGHYFTNAANVTFSYEGECGRRLSAGAEYRRHTGAIRKETFGVRFNAGGKIMKGLDASLEYHYLVSDDLDLGYAESKYTKTLFGLAWRPGNSDKLNVLAKAARIREMRTQAANNSFRPDDVSTVLSLEGIYEIGRGLSLHEKIAAKIMREKISPLPLAKSRTTLWITGVTWAPSRDWDFRAEYRTRHQPTQLNHKDGAAVEMGYTIKDTVRVGLGYNFSSYSDDEFATLDHSYRGIYLSIKGKM